MVKRIVSCLYMKRPISKKGAIYCAVCCKLSKNEANTVKEFQISFDESIGNAK